jgi:S-layer homology domain
VSPSQRNWPLSIGTDSTAGRSLLLRGVAIGLLVAMSGCSGKSLQNTFAPDPKLKDALTVGTKPGETSATLVNTLPAGFPLYPQAQLASTVETKDLGTVTTWTTTDSIESVYKFYQAELPAKQWEIVSTPNNSNPQLEVKQADTSISIAPATSADQQQPGVTTYTISLIAPTGDPAASTAPAVDSTSSPAPTPATNAPTVTPIASTKATTPPTAIAGYLTDLTKIGVLTSADSVPTRVVTRREYARWLVTAHNKITGSKPTQQIKLATADTKPAFQDVPITNPDFPAIQGLAEAGLIPSPLSGDATSVLFRPETPLTREQMILWKIPLDTRQALPAASLDAVKQTWGFQDVGKVDPKALRAVLADFQNGEQSNIRRVFGYTTLFQPKKTVNLGEVAIAIWYFGANSEGLSARDAIVPTENR